MANSIEANGERWRVELSREAPHAGVRAVIFHCTTNTSWGWRVAEVPVTELPDGEAVDRLEEPALRDLFGRSQPFDYVHDARAVPEA